MSRFFVPALLATCLGITDTFAALTDSPFTPRQRYHFSRKTNAVAGPRKMATFKHHVRNANFASAVSPKPLEPLAIASNPIIEPVKVPAKSADALHKRELYRPPAPASDVLPPDLYRSGSLCACDVIFHKFIPLDRKPFLGSRTIGPVSSYTIQRASGRFVLNSDCLAQDDRDFAMLALSNQQSADICMLAQHVSDHYLERNYDPTVRNQEPLDPRAAGLVSYIMNYASNRFMGVRKFDHLAHDNCDFSLLALLRKLSADSYITAQHIPRHIVKHDYERPTSVVKHDMPQAQPRLPRFDHEARPSLVTATNSTTLS